MSNDVSFIVRSQDGFSKTNKRFGQQIDVISKKIAGLDSQLKKIQGNLSLDIKGSFIDTNAIIKPLNQVQQKLKEFSYGTNSTLGKVQRANQHIIKSNKQLAQSFAGVNNTVVKPNSPTPPQPKPNVTPGGGDNISFKNVAKAVGFYRVVEGAINLPGHLIQSRREADSLNATLEAVLPQYDKTKTAAQLAAEEFDYLSKTTYRLGISFNAAKEEYVKFLAASAGKKDSLQDVRKQFEAFASLSRIYGIAPERFKLIMNAMVQIKSKGKIMLEELQNQLGDSLPGAIKLFADALGMSEQKFRHLLSTTGVSANVLKAVADAIFKDTTKMNGLDKASNTLDARINKLNNSWEMFKITLTEGETSELIADGVTTIDYAVQGLTYSVRGLGQAWSDMKDKLENKLHPEIEGKKTIGKAQSFSDYVKKVQQDSVQMSFPSQANTTPIPQEVEVKVIFANAPDGTRAQVSTPSKGGSIGLTTGGF